MASVIAEPLHRRGFILERTGIDTENRTVSLSFSSEEPVPRGFGLEILDHSPDAVNLKRLATGRAPLLLNHEPGQILGVVSSAAVSSRRGKAVVRFGRTPLAEEAWQNVQDGILSNVSVGYLVDETEPITVNGQRGIRAKHWTPMELSLVSIPADASVGVGRSFSKMTTTTEDTPEIREVENQEHVEIMALGRHTGCVDLAKRAILSGESVAQFRKKALAQMPDARPLGEAEHRRELEDDSSNRFGDVGLSEKEVSKYSITRAIESFCRTKQWSGLEAEASRAAAKKYGLQNTDGLHVPNEIMTAPVRRTFNASTFTTGGVFVENQMGNVIDKLRNEALAISLGAKTLTGLVGNSVSPTITGDSTAYWVAEGQSITESEPTTGQLVLTPKRLGAYARVTRKLIMQTSFDVESLIRENIAKVMAIAIDLAIINGSGKGPEPLGILNTSGLSTAVTFSGAATWAKILSFETNLATNNVRPMSAGWLTTPAVRAKWRAIQRFTNTDTPIWRDDNTVNGYPAFATNQVPSDKVIFADWSDVYVGSWAGGFSLIVDPYSESAKGIVGTTIEQFADVGLGHPVSACISTDTGAA